MALNDRQEAFAQHYSRKANATWAAKEAGYSEKTAYQQGHALLKKPEINARIEHIKAERWKALHMGPDETLAEIAKLARFNLGDALQVTEQGDAFLDLSLLDDDGRAALSEVEVHDYLDGRGEDARDVRRVKVKTHSKVQALTLVAKAHGLLTEKVEHTVSDEFADRMAQAMKRARGE